MKLRHYLIPAFVAMPAAFGLITAPTAVADCNSAGYATVCAQGDVRGGGGGGTVAGPVDPYPCSDDWLCNDGVDIVWSPIWPGGPGRPGGPGGGGGIGGGRPGGPR